MGVGTGLDCYLNLHAVLCWDTYWWPVSSFGSCLCHPPSHQKYLLPSTCAIHFCNLKQSLSPHCLFLHCLFPALKHISLTLWESPHKSMYSHLHQQSKNQLCQPLFGDENYFGAGNITWSGSRSKALREQGIVPATAIEKEKFGKASGHRNDLILTELLNTRPPAM